MGTTTNLGLPYPEGTDFVIDGDDAIQALAEALDDYHSQSAKLARITTQSIPDSTTTEVQWTSADSELTSDFDLVTTGVADDTLKYLGPPRFVAWRYGWDLPGSVTSGKAVGVFRKAGLGTPAGDDYVWREIDLAVNAPLLYDSGLVFMDTDSEWQLEVYHEEGSSLACSFYASFKAL